MPALEGLPPLTPLATIALLGLVGVIWLALRVQVLRRRQAAREADEPSVPASDALRRLASWPGTYPLLALIGAALVVLLVTELG